MRRHAGSSSRRGAGFTVLEMMFAVSIFSIIGYSLGVALDAGQDSQAEVLRTSVGNKAMRESSKQLIDELRESSDATITITTLPDGNHELTFQQPITVGTNLVWGVHERKLSTDPLQQTQQNWSVRYTVVSVLLAGGWERTLVRQILDTGGNVRFQENLMEDLKSGAAAPEGFRMVRVGSLWEITMTQNSSTATGVGEGVEFHVQTQN
jgi:type II secretory pathway component PulJ